MELASRKKRPLIVITQMCEMTQRSEPQPQNAKKMFRFHYSSFIMCHANYGVKGTTRSTHSTDRTS